MADSFSLSHSHICDDYDEKEMEGKRRRRIYRAVKWKNPHEYCIRRGSTVVEAVETSICFHYCQNEMENCVLKTKAERAQDGKRG